MKRFKVFDYLHNPVVVCDDTGKILYANKRWINISGKYDGGKSENYLDLLDGNPDEEKDDLFSHPRTMAELHIKDPDSSLIRFLNSESGHPEFYRLSVSRTEEGEYVLNHQECSSCLRPRTSSVENEFLTLVNAVDDLVFIFNPDLTISGTYGKLLMKNMQPRASLSGQRLEELIGSEAELHNSMLTKALTGSSVNYEWSVRFRSKKYHFYSTVSPVFNERKEVVSLVAISKDVTHLLLTKKKAEQSDRLKTAILSGFSHEIRTPLNAILGFSQILAEKEELDEQSRYFAGIVAKRSNDLLEIIENVIETALIQSGEVSVNTDKFSLNKVLDNIYKEVERKNFYNKPDIRLIKVKEVIGKNFHIHSDQKILSQIFRQLLENSYKFTDEGSIEFGYQIEYGKLTFFVKDTGIGIDPEKQKGIWDLFMRAYDYDRSSIGGLGIGLAIVKSLIETLNGKIWCKSLSGKGTGMFFQVPYETEPGDGLMHKTGSPEKNKEYFWPGKKIMIADRNEINILYIREVLKQTGIQLEVVKDCREARRHISETFSCKLLIIDLDLQEECRQAVSSVKKMRPDMNIILITNGKKIENFPEPDDYDEVLFKPLLRDSLLQSIRSYLD